MSRYITAILVAAVLGVAAVPASAAIVQITQSGNMVTPFADNLDGDLTGDGTDDVAITATSFFYSPGAFNLFNLAATIDAQNYTSVGGTLVGSNSVAVTGVSSSTQPNGTSAALVHIFPITFTDAAYGVVGEEGLVEVFLRADDTLPAETRIELRRLVFDPDQRGTPGFNANQSYPEAQRVPEPATLALVALGGAALLRRRRAGR